MRHELSWLRSGPLFRVHRAALSDLESFLDRFGYGRLYLDGRRMTSRQTAHDEIALAFGFPDYYGHNWDAFNGCLGDFVEEHDGELIAVVWDFMDHAAEAAPATAAEVGWALLESAVSSMPTLAPGTSWRLSMDIFAVGDGDDFDRPAVE